MDTDKYNEGLSAFTQMKHAYPWIEHQYDIMYHYDEWLIVGKKAKYENTPGPEGFWYNTKTIDILPIYDMAIFLAGGIIIPRSIDFSFERAKQYFDRGEAADNFFDYGGDEDVKAKYGIGDKVLYNMKVFSKPVSQIGTIVNRKIWYSYESNVFVIVYDISAIIGEDIITLKDIPEENLTLVKEIQEDGKPMEGN